MYTMGSMFYSVLRNSLGLVESSLSCGDPTCAGLRTLWETFYVLQLPSHSGGTIEDLIEVFKRLQELRGSERWSCCQCKSNTSSTVSRRFSLLPQALIVQLNRLDFSDDLADFNHRVVQYPVELTIAVSEATTVRYYLMAAVQYHPEAKHFTVHAKRDTTTFIFDDNRVSISQSMVSRSAYLLLFSQSGVATEQIFGLPNLGNTCYLNACLQFLCTSRELVDAILADCAS